MIFWKNGKRGSLWICCREFQIFSSKTGFIPLFFCRWIDKIESGCFANKTSFSTLNPAYYKSDTRVRNKITSVNDETLQTFGAEDRKLMVEGIRKLRLFGTSESTEAVRTATHTSKGLLTLEDLFYIGLIHFFDIT